MSSGRRKKSKSKKPSRNESSSLPSSQLNEYFPTHNAYESGEQLGVIDARTGDGGSDVRRQTLTSGISTLFRKQPSPEPSAARETAGEGGVGRTRAGSLDSYPPSRDVSPASSRNPPTTPKSTKSAPAVHTVAQDSPHNSFNLMAATARRGKKSKNRKPPSGVDHGGGVGAGGQSPVSNAEVGVSSASKEITNPYPDGGDVSVEEEAMGARIIHSFSGDTFETDLGDESYYDSDHDGRRGGGRARSPALRTMSPRHAPVRLPRRFRGFSTSISSLFLDESIVCGAMSCCGLMLSARTEHLLNERNGKIGLTRRGKKEGGQRAPSRILCVSLIVTIVLLTSTYVIWGFGNNYAMYMDGYDANGNDDGNNGGGSSAYNDDDGGNANDANDDGQVEAADDDGGDGQNDDGGNADDGAAQVDDYQQNADDGNAQVDDFYNYGYADDGYAQADDGAVNNYDDDGNVQADDGAQQNDDANDKNDDQAADDQAADDQAADDQVADDQAAAADDFYGYTDDNNRHLMDLLAFSPEIRGYSKQNSQKHPFNGVMKVRDYRDYVFNPTIRVMNQAYVDLMSQFDEESQEVPSTRKGSTTHNQPQHVMPRNLENESTFSQDEDLSGSVRSVIIAIFLFMLGVVGRRRRMRTRFAILRSRAQDDHLYYAALLSNPSNSIATPDGTVMENFHEREDKYDGACSHTLFGCYPVDNQPAIYADYGDDDETHQTLDSEVSGKKRKGGDFMNRATTRLFDCCCSVLCKCWCQLFSICALAQEARETRLLLPPKLQRIDLITHQPFHEYAKDVNNIRRRYMEEASRTFMQHYAALSHLSRYIILTFFLTSILVMVTMLVHPTGGFVMGDVVVLVATFVQSFLVLITVFGIFHKSDLSLDAVIKFFAVGFVICVPMGFIIEGFLLNMVMMSVYGFYYLFKFTIGESFDSIIVQYHQIFWMIGELFNAYFIASLVEELCKYYAFRFIEHPDLIFLTGLDRSAQQANGGGGIDTYKYDSQIVSEFSRRNEADDDDDRKGKRGKKSKIVKNNDEEDELELRTLRQQAAAITTGMISVAVGLACAENFIYVFFLGGTGGMDSLSEEWTILLFRSIFPVHALSAALQSINMITKFIEAKHGASNSIGVGKIIFPALLLHGTFDAILMSINAYIETAWDNYIEENNFDDNVDVVPYNSFLVNLVACFGITIVMLVSFGWYAYQNKVQKLRLKAIEMRERSGYPRYNASNAPGLV